MPSATPLLDAALWAAEQGWPVFPLKPRGSFPALHSREDCPQTGACADGHRTWEQRATDQPARIHGCWTHDDYNVGLATGPGGLCVIDMDVPKPGKPVPDRWAQQGAQSGMDVFLLVCADAGQTPPLDTFTVTTPSGGTHLYYTAPQDVELRITQGERGHGLGWGIDTRAWGGYVVAPGSTRRDGTYTITNTQAPAPLPRWLVNRLTPDPLPPQQPSNVTPISGRRSKFLQSAINSEIERVTNAEQGGRNFALYCAANALGQLVAGGALDEQEVTDLLLHAAQSHVAVGAYRWIQARKTIASGLRAGAKRPRKVAA